MFKSLFFISILALSFNAVADSKYYCSSSVSYKLVKGYSIKKVEEYKPKDCKKDDIININVTDLDNRSNEGMYLSYEISELCSNELEITIIKPNRAVCTYRGSRRSKK